MPKRTENGDEPAISITVSVSVHVNCDVMPAISQLSLEAVLAAIRGKKAVIVAAKSHNAAVEQAVQIFRKLGCEDYEVIDLETAGAKRESIEQALFRLTSRTSLPLVFVKGDCVGNADDLKALNSTGVLKEWLADHGYDLIIIGGGSGGLAVAQEAGGFGKKVACLDFVVPTPQGTTWGLGGTCVNVGCIPKKLMHHAALLGHSLQDAKKFGWSFDSQVSHDWATMKDAVQAHVSSLNWASCVSLRMKQVKYLNSHGKFVGSHTVVATDKNGAKETLTADRFLIATGLRPRYPDVPGAKEYCITSDDIFKLPYPPGKTLVVGASYVGLECAGFLRGTGFDTTVMVRSILLRGFDQDMAERIGKHMESIGIRFIKETIPTKVEMVQNGTPRLLRVTAKKTNGGELIEGEYNTVLFAVGRDAITDDLGFESAGIKRNEKNKKVVCRENEQSVSAPYVYAIGDVLDGGIELTPVAVQAGRLLARRFFSDSNELCDYVNVPTTVFTPLEYGCCGLSEDAAMEKYGGAAIEVYHVQYEPLEFAVPKREPGHCYLKLICNKNDDMRVLGFHILGPDAGEITQGFALALKLNAKKADFDQLIGIHPTVAENFTTLKVTKASKKESKSTNC